ncbi:hypothetical protein Hanom_Chr10g00902451 [Helianthus anomalus]
MIHCLKQASKKQTRSATCKGVRTDKNPSKVELEGQTSAIAWESLCPLGSNLLYD